MAILKVHKDLIVDGHSPVRLKGVNLGGWLMPEGYIMHAPNWGYQFFRKKFIKAMGNKALVELERAFRDNYIQEDDFRRIRSFGFNSIRLPFHYGLVETKPFQYSQEGVGYLDRAICWAKKNDLRIILDMHAAPGAQNCDWHGDSDGRALFWTKKSYQDRAAALWGFLADRYKDEETLAGYDLLNETVLEDPRLMIRYYQQAIKAIRAVDRKHIVFVEGNRWAQEITCLDDISDDNLVLGIHFYEPLEFTALLIPDLTYPFKGAKPWGSAMMRKRLEIARKTADRAGRPLWCGEFGVHNANGRLGEDRWVADILRHFKELDIHWHYWTWKAIKNHMLPDGVYSYFPNDPWVNRLGPLTGWETWHLHWKDNKKAMSASWRTEAFQENKKIGQVLRHASRKDQ
ncbi:MAG: glycoside hydrolase family 5 protein [Candidatus Omnitrophica bacterium]|nr:glycoside hydrolase family 5 protein [Candidatus Omnitrophota bacterium]